MEHTLITVAVTGADSGLGAAIAEELLTTQEQEDRVFSVIRLGGPDSLNLPSFDLTKDEDILRAAEYIREISASSFRAFKHMKENLGRGKGDTFHQYNILVNCAGVNYIEWFPEADWKEFDRLMNLNLRAPLKLTQDLLLGDWLSGNYSDGWFHDSGAVLNIISNASHMAMTNSVFYNASKGALHIATLAMNRELRKTHGLTVFGISPNKLSGTGMSSYIEDRVPELRGWTPEQAAKYQEGALPAQAETPPKVLAEFIAFLLSNPERHRYLAGTVLPYGG